MPSAARLALPGLEAWGEGKELLLGAAVIGVVLASFVLGVRLARPRGVASQVAG